MSNINVINLYLYYFTANSILLPLNLKHFKFSCVSSFKIYTAYPAYSVDIYVIYRSRAFLSSIVVEEWLQFSKLLKTESHPTKGSKPLI